ncbi:MAG: hypothetical protein ABMA00_22135, partial [Gemmatimonas sp.]
MEASFVRELAQARAHGRLSSALASTAGVWDVIKRSVYERVRLAPNSASPMPTTAQLLRRLAASFAIAFVGLTALLLLQYAGRQIPAMDARGVLDSARLVLLAVPFTAAMTIPMAVFLAVLHRGVDATGAFLYGIPSWSEGSKALPDDSVRIVR